MTKHATDALMTSYKRTLRLRERCEVLPRCVLLGGDYCIPGLPTRKYKKVGTIRAHVLKKILSTGSLATCALAIQSSRDLTGRLPFRLQWPFAIGLLAVKNAKEQFLWTIILSNSRKMNDLVGFDISETRKVPS